MGRERVVTEYGANSQPIVPPNSFVYDVRRSNAACIGPDIPSPIPLSPASHHSRTGMKIIYKEYHPVASWRWDVDPDGGNRGPNVEDSHRAIPDGIPDEPGLVGDDGPARDEEDDDDDDDDDDDEDDEEMCGVCQQEFESACPACKVPGDDCPLSTFPHLNHPFFPFRLPYCTTRSS